MVSDPMGAQAALLYHTEQGSGDSAYAASSMQGAGSVDSSSHKSFASPRRSKVAAGRKSASRINGRDVVNATITENGHQEEDLWSSILNSVKSSRAVPVKNVIILGEPGTGKSTLLSQIASLSPSGYASFQASNREDAAITADKAEESADLGLGYSYFDVGDEDGEDVVARVGVYQVSSSDSAHLSLLPLALSNPADSRTAYPGNADETHASKSRLSKAMKGVEELGSQIDTKQRPSVDALRDSLFIITLDWEAPWTFLSHLSEWLDVVREIIEQATNTSKVEWSREQVVWEEMKESVEASIRAYSDAAGPIGAAALSGNDGDEVGETSVASAIVPVANPAANDGEERAPLADGCLTHNFGVPLVVVCTKADTIGQLEKERNFKEEKFDYVQQVLRTICLKYGAGLFFTSQTKPATFEVLRSYLLHHLFSPSSHGTSTSAFAFMHRASTVERDVLLVPAGWDSFGKIRALRDAFDCAGMANGWEWDAQVERIRRSLALPKGSRQAEEIAEQQIDRRTLPGLVEGDRSNIESTIKLYEAIVEDWDANAEPHGNHSSRIKEPDEQAFLLQHYTTMQREPEAKAKTSRQSSSSAAAGLSRETGRSVVGPVGSSSLSLPGVEQALLERQQIDEGKSVKVPSSSRKEGHGTRDRERERERERERDRDSGRATPQQRNSASAAALQSPPMTSSDKSGGSRPTSPSGGTPKQSEVLHSFFQSLLKEKTPAPNRGSTRERKNVGQ